MCYDAYMFGIATGITLTVMIGILTGLGMIIRGHIKGKGARHE